MSTLVESVTLEVGPGEVEEHLSVVEVVELTKTVLVLCCGNGSTKNEDWELENTK